MSAFAQIWDTPAKKIEDAAEEAIVIKEAQARSEAAVMRLFGAYVPAIKAAMKTYSAVLSVDDLRQAALLGFMETIHRHDGRSERLAGALRQRLMESLSAAVSESAGGLAVPERTMKRFFGILKAANGDAAEGARLAPQHEMREETFLAIFAAVRADDSLDLEIEIHGDAAFFDSIPAPREIADVEDRILVEAAFRAVDEQERNICRLAYGFAEYDVVPDAEIGHRYGMGRLRVQRSRVRALAKMRKALCAE
ncbi:hypothetical protein [Actinoplanes philippinensis]|uniref:hypothetical protein n=1 Tax=Actinoplanes philippinensis TaxID=35752 RepID=UPI0033CB2ED2